MKLTETITAFAFAGALTFMSISTTLVDAEVIGGCCSLQGCNRCTAVNGTSGKIPTGNCNSFKPLAHIQKGCLTSDCSTGCFTPTSQDCFSGSKWARWPCIDDCTLTQAAGSYRCSG